jgi:D-glucosaminate PTS system EIIB component
MARIDDRFIHGQVVVGCCASLHAERVVLCDEAVARDQFQSRLYAAAVPDEISVDFLGVVESARLLESLSEKERGQLIVVTGDCATMLALCEASPVIESVCIGGMHHHSESQEFWPGFFLSAGEVACLRTLLDRGVELRVQSIPGEPAVDASQRLRAVDQSP